MAPSSWKDSLRTYNACRGTTLGPMLVGHSVSHSNAPSGLQFCLATFSECSTRRMFFHLDLLISQHQILGADSVSGSSGGAQPRCCSSRPQPNEHFWDHSMAPGGWFLINCAQIWAGRQENDIFRFLDTSCQQAGGSPALDCKPGAQKPCSGKVVSELKALAWQSGHSCGAQVSSTTVGPFLCPRGPWEPALRS